ncbi:possible H+-antiporter [Vibrio maritimus]|uniref:Possible H+-antiporter n=1 Tax=Vibrio maritimus TaxID=990268 RepID=A0A090S167_9VIBR|nr:possible H+-antiporter [Vibrio maritimus]
MGLNQTLLFSFLPYIADVLGISGSSLEWSGVIILLNVNLLSYFIGSSYWPSKITSNGFAVSARLAFVGYAAVSVIFIFVLTLLLFDLSCHWMSLIILGATRFAMGYFSSAFLPIAHGYILAQNHDHASQYKQLSKASSALTLGRLIGPGLALIPINWLLILVVPLLPMLWSYFQCSSIDNNRQNHKSQLLPIKQRLKLVPTWTLICALLTTAWVASFQLALAPEVHRLIPTPAEASHQLAMFLLGVSIVALFGQAMLMPYSPNLLGCVSA